MFEIELINWFSSFHRRHKMPKHCETSLKFVPVSCHVYICSSHRLNMELDLQNLFGILCNAVLIG
jgi:hypothetical protein